MRAADAKGAKNPNWFERAVKDVQQKLHEHFPRSPNPPAEGAPGAARARDLAARYGDDHARLDTLPSAYEVGEDVSFSERWDARDSARDSVREERSYPNREESGDENDEATAKPPGARASAADGTPPARRSRSPSPPRDAVRPAVHAVIWLPWWMVAISRVVVDPETRSLPPDVEISSRYVELRASPALWRQLQLFCEQALHHPSPHPSPHPLPTPLPVPCAQMDAAYEHMPLQMQMARIRASQMLRSIEQKLRKPCAAPP